MKKWKIYFSLLKERDWLEDMARQGWILTDINWGIRYHFKKSEPCEKVFEIERFAISSQPTVQELSARKMAMDIVSQSDWELVTHDEDMNYYFMKDKAGDETDEFYDEESRHERAERYRKHYSYDMPIASLGSMLFFSVVYFFLLLALDLWNSDIFNVITWIYFGLTTLEILTSWATMKTGNTMHRELMMSREEWENHKSFSQKKSFKKVQHLRVFLQEQSEKGLALTGFKAKRYTFEKDERRYNYFIDTSACLRKRMKAQGVSYKDDKKDWLMQGLKWYETSISEAAKYNLKPVAAIGNNIIIYKRPFSDEKIPWENGNENLASVQIHPVMAIIMVIACVIGFAIGFGWATTL